jgi:hypothetical protein
METRQVSTDAGDNDALYRAALEVERNESPAQELAEWDVTTEDGLTPPV